MLVEPPNADTYRHRISVVVAVGAAALILTSGALAQQMPNTGAWLNSMIGMQYRMQGYGNVAVNRIYQSCLLNPVECRKAAAAARQDNFISRLQNQYTYNNWKSQFNALQNQRAIDKTRRAITGEP